MRIAIIGTGFVGSTVAYSILQRGVASELILIDKDVSRAQGEAMDLSHAVPYLKNAKIRVSSLEEPNQADLVIIAAGRNSVPGETRLDLLQDNAGRIRSICASLKKWKNGVLVLVISNPVDVLTQIAADELNWEARVLGSGTSLDTARLKALIGEKLGLDPHSIHAYILGEHGDSEFPAWSTAMAGGIPIRDWPDADSAALNTLFEKVRSAAYEIIKRKKATYYGIGATAALISEALLRDQHSVLPVSVPLRGQYGLSGVSLSLPCVLGRKGILKILEPKLDPEETQALLRSAGILSAALSSARPALPTV